MTPAMAGRRLRALLRTGAAISPVVQSPLPSSALPLEPDWIVDAPRDCRYAAAPHAAFSDVLSVMTQQWVGIRAATGSFPGRKLAVSKDIAWTDAEVRRVCELIDAGGIRKVVLQGASFVTLDLLAALRVEMPELKIFGVWHGTLAAWAFEEERRLAQCFFDLATAGVFDRIALLRRGMHNLHPRAVPYLLPNLPPMVAHKRLAEPFSGERVTCLFGSWNNQWKNMHANLLAATLCERVDAVLTYAAAEIPAHLPQKARMLPYGSREAHLTNLAMADLALNVTVVDCHPMVELEALAVGTPTLRGELDLDFGEDHPFSQLLTVASPHDIGAIVDRIEAVASVPSRELSAIVEDYRRLVVRTSLERYGRFFSEAS